MTHRNLAVPQNRLALAKLPNALSRLTCTHILHGKFSTYSTDSIASIEFPCCIDSDNYRDGESQCGLLTEHMLGIDQTGRGCHTSHIREFISLVFCVGILGNSVCRILL